MDEIRKEYMNGRVTRKDFKQIAVNKTFEILESRGIKKKKNLGCGGFGVVAEIKKPKYKILSKYFNSHAAVKIVLEDEVSESEIHIWKDFQHVNLVPLLSKEYLPSAQTYVFTMPLYPSTLEDMLRCHHFHSDCKALNRAINWLRNVTDGISYLHNSKYCHLDIKIDNILISESDTAVITDFGCATSGEGLTTKYGTPWIYRPPEAGLKMELKPPLDGFKLDCWCYGILALEMFTSEAYYRKTRTWSEWRDNYWAEQTYPAIFYILQQSTFRYLMMASFPRSDVTAKTAECVRSVILCCLNMDPVERPSFADVREQKLFGGEKFYELDYTDVWNEKASTEEILLLIERIKMKEGYREIEMPNMEINEIILNEEKISDEVAFVDTVKVLEEEKSSKEIPNVNAVNISNEERFSNDMSYADVTNISDEENLSHEITNVNVLKICDEINHIDLKVMENVSDFADKNVSERMSQIGILGEPNNEINENLSSVDPKKTDVLENSSEKDIQIAAETEKQVAELREVIRKTPEENSKRNEKYSNETSEVLNENAKSDINITKSSKTAKKTPNKKQRFLEWATSKKVSFLNLFTCFRPPKD